jgi:methyltransferase (TIGR00027 family)
MEKGKRSYMAEGTALLRAVHQVIDDEPRVLEDPLAVTLLGEDIEAQIKSDIERHSRWYLVKARTLAVMRSRYTEDELSAAIGRGVSQYVILGAGLDTSPYRRGHPAEKLQTYEVDHPDTQRWKLERLREAGIEPRGSIRHVGIDFERQSLGEGLAGAGFDRSQPAFFSWLGVAYYLERESVMQVCRYVAESARESQLVFDFVLDDASLNEAEREAVQKISAFVETQNEPWLTRFSPAELQEALRGVGFRHVKHFDRDLATERYLSNRSDGLALDVAIQMMSAIA